MFKGGGKSNSKDNFFINNREILKQWLEIKKRSLKIIVYGFEVFSISVTTYITSIIISWYNSYVAILQVIKKY